MRAVALLPTVQLCSSMVSGTNIAKIITSHSLHSDPDRDDPDLFSESQILQTTVNERDTILFYR
jgi:hypothetical protein